jgi:mersacidin/lichenicidin family type 2 lantibiotic
MSNLNIIKAWKNAAYRKSLSAAELAALPSNPAGSVEVSDEALGKTAGAVIKKTDIACTMFSECTNLGCPTRICF